MKYIVYLTTNLKSKANGINKIYIGVHKTENPEIFDGYIGCGVNIYKASTYMYPKTPFQCAVKKYGTEAFHRNILYIFDSAEEAFSKEAELVSLDFINQDFTYNVALGGTGGSLKSLDPKKHSLPLYQFDLEGNLVKFWETTLEACDFFGYDYNHFSWAIVDKCLFLNSYWSREDHIDSTLYGNSLLKCTYLYTLSGKLIYSFGSRTACAQFLDCTPQAVSNAVRNENKIKEYYVSDKLVDEYTPKPRKQLKNQRMYLYEPSIGFIGEFVGKEIMPILNVYSFGKISSAINDNRGWYKNYFISLKKIDKLPEKYTHNKRVDIYTKEGNFVETLGSVKEVKEKYNLNSAQINRILKGIKSHENFIFKYSK